MKMTEDQAKAFATSVEYFFEKAAKTWELGNNSGHGATLTRCEAECEKLRDMGEALLAPFGITCDYPGLYPCFRWDGHDYHDVLGVVRWATVLNEKA